MIKSCKLCVLSVGCEPIPVWLNIATDNTDPQLGDLIDYKCQVSQNIIEAQPKEAQGGSTRAVGNTGGGSYMLNVGYRADMADKIGNSSLKINQNENLNRLLGSLKPVFLLVLVCENAKMKHMHGSIKI